MTGVSISDLKAHLSEHLRAVRRGETVTVLDRQTPVARIVPWEAPSTLPVRASKRPFGSMARPTAAGVSVDALNEALDAERQSAR